jgi:hypothetical protein
MKNALTKVNKLGSGHKAYKFQAALQMPVEQGPYLLRVDFLDRQIPNFPQSLIATQSLFIEISGTAKRQRQAHTVTIGSPKSGDKYTTAANIGVGGTATKGQQVRIRFLKDSTIYQETIVNRNVDTNQYSGTLNNPQGGWPTGTATIQCQSLDGSGNPISGEVATVNITIIQP